MRSLAGASRFLETLYNLIMAHNAAFSHFFLPFADQRVLVGVQFDVVADCLVDQIAARTVLRGSQRIKRLNLFRIGTEADGFLGSHNTVTISCIILYYKTFSQCRSYPIKVHAPRSK